MLAACRLHSRCWIWLLCAAFSSWPASSRYIKETIQIGLAGGNKMKAQHKVWDHKKWHYVAKFAFEAEGGSVQIRVRIKNGFQNYPTSELHRAAILSIDLNAYNEKKWYTAKRVMDKYAADFEIQAHQMCELSGKPYHIKPRAHRVVEFPFDNDRAGENWGDWVELTFAPEHRPHMWYFTLSDCNHKLHKSELEFEMKLIQQSGGEFSIEREFSIPAHYLAIGLLSAFLMYWFYRLHSQEGSWANVFQLHPLMFALTYIMMFQFLGHFLHLIHLTIFQADGQGLEWVDVGAEIVMMLAQTCTVLVLIMLARGYAITDMEPEIECTVFIVLGIIGVHALVLVVSHFSGSTEAPHRLHGHEGAYGYVLVTMRVLLFCWFLFESEGTKNTPNPKVLRFMRKLQAIGCLYFLTYPFMFGIIKFVAPYFQHRVMQAVLLSVHFLMDVILAHMFLAGGDHFRLKSGWFVTRSFFAEDEDVLAYDTPVTDMGATERTPMTEEARRRVNEMDQQMVELSKLTGVALDVDLENTPTNNSAPEPTTFGKDA